MESEFRLGEWTVFPKLNSVEGNGQSFHLEPKVMQVLTCLAESGDIVSKEALMRTVWADTFVTDDVLTRSISELRKVFADDPKRPQYIQTIPKSGYRLLIPATPVPHEPSPPVAPVQPSQVATPQLHMPPFPAVSRRAIAFAFLATVSGLVIVALAYFKSKPDGSEAAVVSAGRNMLAVLPFQNLNNDPQHDYYADGLTAEMISQLGRLPSDRLGVIDWHSMIRYKGTKKSEDEIARELGANYVLEGTVRSSGTQLRITAELVHVGDRSHVWANSYDGTLEDVLSLQNRVAREIASEIQLRLTPEQEARLGTPAPLNPEGYKMYLEGKFSAQGVTSPGLMQTIERFQKAIELNPDYAPPYVGLAVAYRQLASEGFAPASAYREAHAALEKAVKLDPGMAEAWHELGWVEWRNNWNFSAAEKNFHRAIELNPGNTLVHSGYGLFLKGMGRFSEALSETNQSAALSPMEPYGQANAGHLLGLMQRYSEAENRFRKALELGPNLPYVHERYGALLLWEGKKQQGVAEFEKAAELSHSQPEKLAWLAYAYAVNGQETEARSLLSRTQRIAREQGQFLSSFPVAAVYAGLNDKENAFRWLEDAYSQHDEWLVYLRVYPEFQNLRSDSRFQNLERRIGLIQ